MPESAAISIIRSITPTKVFERKRTVVTFESSTSGQHGNVGETSHCPKCLRSEHRGQCSLRFEAHSE